MISKIVLASSSPRRAELLGRIGLEFEVVPPLVEENYIKGESPVDFVLRASKEKSLSVSTNLNSEFIVIGADTIVVLDEEILGKPRNEREAKSMLERLSGRDHHVITGLTILRPKQEILYNDFIQSEVKFKSLYPWEVKGYIKTKEPLDKAGGYGAQGIGAFMIEEIHGSFTNVVGLPLAQLSDALTKLGILKLFTNDGSTSEHQKNSI
jgi:septum formation protein